MTRVHPGVNSRIPPEAILIFRKIARGSGGISESPPRDGNEPTGPAGPLGRPHQVRGRMPCHHGTHRPRVSGQSEHTTDVIQIATALGRAAHPMAAAYCRSGPTARPAGCCRTLPAAEPQWALSDHHTSLGERNNNLSTRTWRRGRGAGPRKRSSLRLSRLACSRSSPSQWRSLASTWSCQAVTGLPADSQQRSCARYIDASCVTIRVRTNFRMEKLRQLGKSRKWASRAPVVLSTATPPGRSCG